MIGKLHDYYDGLMAYGQDDTLTFHRETIEHKSKSQELKDAAELVGLDEFRRGYYNDRFMYPQTELTTKNFDRHLVKTIMVGFCGKVYFGLSVEIIDPKTYIKTTKYIYTHDDAAKLDLKYEYITQFERQFFNEGKRTRWLSNVMSKYSHLFSGIDATEFSIKYKVPYFVIEMSQGMVDKVTFVPELKKYEFQKVVDPYTAYQELSMFLGGVMPRQMPEMVEISDKDRIAQHGFNKLSFRHPVKFKRVK